MLAQLARLSNNYARIKMLERKQDTRKKIQLGGLIKKAGLSEESSAVLLGMLLEAAEKLEGKNATKIRQDWKIRGDIAFTLEKKTT